jgi:hypothetical protein
LAGATTGYLAFSAIPSIADGDTVWYFAVSRTNPTTEWESGIATYNSGTNSLTRTDGGVLNGSSGAGARVSFTAGTKDVFSGFPALGTWPVARGGTGSSTALANGKVMRSSGGAIVESEVGVSSSTLTVSNNIVLGTIGYGYGVESQTSNATLTVNTLGASSSIDIATNSSLRVRIPQYPGVIFGDGADAAVIRTGTNSLRFCGSDYTSGGATTRVEINKSVTGISDATATDVFTVTVPNSANSASIRVRLTGSAGAGGAIGANESTQDAEYMINITRTAGVNAVATIGAVVGQAAAATVAGGNNVAVTGTLSAVSGAVGATNTFTVKVTVTRAAGSATNHTCTAFAELINANASGVTIT